MMTPVHSFEISGKGGGGLMGMFGGKPQLNLFDNGIGWTEGKEKVFVEFAKVTTLKFSKYYSVLSIAHSATGAPQTKKMTLINIGMFETIWTDFARKKGLTLKLTAE
ncbi:MAG: hypothetical protein FWF81_09580 [Defluviitaleaceae bacterium]|nr:hypothetical protein [Defluviitaleaceae bacterium]